MVCSNNLFPLLYIPLSFHVGRFLPPNINCHCWHNWSPATIWRNQLSFKCSALSPQIHWPLWRAACSNSPHSSFSTQCWQWLFHGCKFLQSMVSQHCVDIAAVVGCCMIYTTRPRPPCAAIQISRWYNGRRTTVMAFYITLSPLHSPQKIAPCYAIRSTAAKWPCTWRFPLFYVWKMAIQLLPTYSQPAVLDLLEAPASFDTIVQQNSLTKRLCNRIC